MTLRQLVTYLLAVEAQEEPGRPAARQLFELLCGEPGVERQEDSLANSAAAKPAAPGDAAVESALINFEYGMYLVVVDGAEIPHLDVPIRLQSDSRVEFVRLTLGLES